jgi:hypothetical protein
MRNYIINQLTQITAWIGFGIVILELFRVPDWLIMFVGVWLILIDDEMVKRWCAKAAPELAEKLRKKD